MKINNLNLHLLNKKIKILSLVLLSALLVQITMLSAVTFLHQNFNETLTASCCQNIGIDDDCKAKCFVEKTQQQDQENQEITIKKDISYFLISPYKVTLNPVISPVEKSLYSYLQEYTFIFSKENIKPPLYTLSV